jgi:hypothetical protein
MKIVFKKISSNFFDISAKIEKNSKSSKMSFAEYQKLFSSEKFCEIGEKVLCGNQNPEELSAVSSEKASHNTNRDNENLESHSPFWIDKSSEMVHYFAFSS